MEEEENGSDVSDEDEDELDEEYEDRKEPKSVEELKIRAFHLSEKKNRKKTLIQERNQQQGMLCFCNLMSKSRSQIK